MEDEDFAISYKVLQRGTPVHASGGEHVGTVERVLDNVREDIFDGIVITTPQGLRFADAYEVARITERRVTLELDAEAAAALPAYEAGAPEFRADPRAGRLSRAFGGSWKRRR